MGTDGGSRRLDDATPLRAALRNDDDETDDKAGVAGPPPKSKADLEREAEEVAEAAGVEGVEEIGRAHV